MIYAEDKHGHGIRGLLPYASTFNTRVKGDTRAALSSQRVYRFKAQGESAEVWRKLVEQAAADLGCVAVWVVPPHDPNATSRLQELFGVSIRRARTVERRKYHHSGPVETNSMDYPSTAPGRVLLVDDVATTGATLVAIRDHLAGMGIEAVPLALGLNHRLCKGADEAALSAQWEVVAAEVHPAGRDANERRRDRRKAASSIPRRQCADPARRKKLEADPAAWLRWYCATAFPLPWGQVHRDIIKAAERSIRTGAGMVCACPRGTGKSTLLWAMGLWALLSGACQFPVVAGWSHSAARRMLRKWVQALADGDRLADDYPEVCDPFRTSTHSNRLRALGWEDSGEPCGADVRTGDGVVVLPDGLGALGAVSISGNVRGLHAGLPDGSTIRPDCLLLDDPQDTATAESPALTRKTVERLEADLFSMSGPGTRLSVMCAATVISDGDVATHFLQHEDFETIKIGQVVSWPDGWDDADSPVRALWAEWNKVRVEGLEKRDGGRGARRFYREHKREMTAGMVVSWLARFDKKRHDPDACYAAMFDYYRLGERAFMAERQGAPMKTATESVFELPHAHVARHVNGLARRTAPDNAVALVGMCDVNADGLRWALAAATNSRALSVVDYGVFPGHGRPMIGDGESEAVAIMRGLNGLDAVLSQAVVSKGDERLPIELMLLDCGGSWMQTVFDWLASAGRTSRLPWCASRGWGSRSYRPGRNIIGRPGDGWHVASWPGKGRVLVHNSDLWRHRQQKGWLLPAGAPDSIAFFGAENERHEVFADGVVAERLVAYAETDQGPLYKWQIVPGMRNDFGDVATGLFVAASRLGLAPTVDAGDGVPVRPKTAPARVLVYRPSQHGRGRRAW